MLKTIRFGWIAPFEYLNFIPDEDRFHLVLVSLLENEVYAEFYRKKAERGDTIIVDNMAFEHKSSIPADDLIQLIDNSGLKPTYVVAPDYPFEDWKKTVDSTNEFIEKVKDKPYKVMAVPQSQKGDWRGWLQSYQEFYNNKSVSVIGMSILGIPNAFCSLTGTDDIAFNRIFATQYILSNRFATPNVKWHHYLGLGLPREILIQRQLGLIDSNDSSSPIWHGILGIRYDNSWGGLKDGKSQIPVNFNIEAVPNFVEDIKFNVDYFQERILY